MTIHVAATYENGVLRPAEPLDLPNQTLVHVTVTPHRDSPANFNDATEAEIEAELRKPSKLTIEEFRKIMRENTLRAGTLPIDFDRDDIYSDHD